MLLKTWTSLQVAFSKNRKASGSICNLAENWSDLIVCTWCWFGKECLPDNHVFVI